MEDSRQNGSIPRALPPPEGPVIVLDASLVSRAVDMSRKSPRRRMILPLHPSGTDPLQRMVNALQPGSYIRPHRHLHPPKAESVVLLQGAIGFVTFQEEGRLDRVFILSAGSNQMGIDAAPGIYHTFFALKANTVLYEAKSGPFAATPEKDFAPWAPPEGSPAAPGFLDDLVQRVSSTSDGISMKTQ